MRVIHTLAAAAVAAAIATPAVGAWELSGVRTVKLETGDGETIPIGTVTFSPSGDQVAFRLDLDAGRFSDFFLSMREFKCLEGKEIQCHVPYPYANPRMVAEGDLSWLETALIFMFKTPAQFGATLSNGLYYPLRKTERGLAGTPHLVDLNQIAAPPEDPSRPPFSAADRLEVEGGGRWIAKLLIE